MPSIAARILICRCKSDGTFRIWTITDMRLVWSHAIRIQVPARHPQGPVKVLASACSQCYESLIRKETPHPPPCGSPSPQGRGFLFDLISLSLGERGDRKAVGEGSLASPRTLTEPWRHPNCRLNRQRKNASQPRHPEPRFWGRRTRTPCFPANADSSAPADASESHCWRPFSAASEAANFPNPMKGSCPAQERVFSIVPAPRPQYIRHRTFQ
jgi:hypothetical protein